MQICIRFLVFDQGCLKLCDTYNFLEETNKNKKIDWFVHFLGKTYSGTLQVIWPSFKSTVFLYSFVTIQTVLVTVSLYAVVEFNLANAAILQVL